MLTPIIFSIAAASPLFSGHAYLDPGSGSIILQLVIAGLLGAGVLVGAFWRKIKALFQKKPSGNDSTSEDNDS